ncbi:hypothetical protein PtB15_3B218 [Puccinia triticina]|nr:hypothetical protein PtB15_3B218 [Puccinia triticina]
MSNPVQSSPAQGAGSTSTNTLANYCQDRDNPPHQGVTPAGGGDGEPTDPPIRQPTQRPSRRDLVDADLDRVASGVIGSITHRFCDADRLLADGSNYGALQDFINERMRDALNVTDFYWSPTGNIYYKHVGRTLLLNSSNQSLRHNLTQLATAHMMYTDLSMHFNSVSGAAHVNLYRRLVNFEASEHFSTTAITAHISGIFNKMTAMQMPSTRNHWAGLALQNVLSAEPKLQAEFNRHLEIELQDSTPEYPLMTFTKMVQLIDQIRRQQQTQDARRGRSQNTSTLSMNAAAMTPTPPAQQPINFPTPPPRMNEMWTVFNHFTNFHPDNVPDVHDFTAIQAGLC